jgi:hypothetical protein
MREVNQSPSASRLISGTKYSSRSPSLSCAATLLSETTAWWRREGEGE